MRINFGTLFQKNTKDKTMSGLVHIPEDTNLWPEQWKRTQYKTYDRFPQIPLPSPTKDTQNRELFIQRTSVRDFKNPSDDNAHISLQKLSNILFYSCGEVSKNTLTGAVHRAQPSAGARYPIEAYVLNFIPGSLKQACHHYRVGTHALEELWEFPPESLPNDIRNYFHYPWSTKASLAIILTGIPRRTMMKYGERGYRYLYLEAGAILNNIHMHSLSENIGSVIMGSTDETQLERLLDLDGEEETVILGILLGEK